MSGTKRIHPGGCFGTIRQDTTYITLSYYIIVAFWLGHRCVMRFETGIAMKSLERGIIYKILKSKLRYQFPTNMMTPML